MKLVYFIQQIRNTFIPVENSLEFFKYGFRYFFIIINGLLLVQIVLIIQEICTTILIIILIIQKLQHLLMVKCNEITQTNFYSLINERRN